MAILTYAETEQGRIKKAAFEAVYYGKKLGEQTGQTVYAVVLGSADNPAQLGAYGADEVYHLDQESLNTFDSRMYTRAIAGMADRLDAEYVVLAHSANGKSLLGRLSVHMEAGAVSGVNALPDTEEGLTVRKLVFSGKAFGHYEINTEKKILSVMGSTFSTQKEEGAEADVQTAELDLPEPQVELIELDTVEGKVPLPEADLVVSGGRGMKGPENWHLLEDLADELGAALACSRPVADNGWRPHHEHVGQTGVTIRPQLYLAVGISGAIQHLAGVNNSKYIVVINKDPEAPFFKAADYGVVADLFDVVPRLTEALKEFNEEHE